MYLESDLYSDWVETCLQCGYTRYLDMIAQVPSG